MASAAWSFNFFATNGRHLHPRHHRLSAAWSFNFFATTGDEKTATPPALKHVVSLVTCAGSFGCGLGRAVKQTDNFLFF